MHREERLKSQDEWNCDSRGFCLPAPVIMSCCVCGWLLSPQSSCRVVCVVDRDLDQPSCDSQAFVSPVIMSCCVCG